MPVFIVRWRQEGETEVEAIDTLEACDIVVEMLQFMNVPTGRARQNDLDDAEILDCEEVE